MKAVDIAVADVRNADISLEQCTVIIMVDLFFSKDVAALGCDLENQQQVVQAGERRESCSMV
jgi:hypothetical protein